MLVEDFWLSSVFTFQIWPRLPHCRELQDLFSTMSASNLFLYGWCYGNQQVARFYLPYSPLLRVEVLVVLRILAHSYLSNVNVY